MEIVMFKIIVRIFHKLGKCRTFIVIIIILLRLVKLISIRYCKLMVSIKIECFQQFTFCSKIKSKKNLLNPLQATKWIYRLWLVCASLVLLLMATYLYVNVCGP
ncbi:hypothetical protein BpHYR1_009003 [Brachionus plicatilis]|uniref:Uncharacterized protein n=1 Tax=Brachionus plicatilis TaxID=10195 RepID=A0A3M7QDN8_BRAPC|nr:hypothetical protein BpHYR1_009003 [Brachionus plicatilis]